MKKNLLIGAFLLGSFLTAKAQTSCATALDLPVGSITTVGDITGTYVDNCFADDPNEGATAANWYKYTATANGILRVNTNLEVNDGDAYSDDTRISVFTGACASLTCYAALDDVDATNYLTDIAFQVLNGQTYYIAFDNNWEEMGFQVEATFTEVSCFSVTGGFTYSGTPTTSEVTISWTAALNSPVGYEVLWGATGFDPETEGTLIENLTTPQATFSGLTAATTYDMYVRTNCGDDNFSTWVGPVSFETPFAPATVPYSYGFEDENGGGWSTLLVTGAGWTPAAGDDTVPAHTGDVLSYAIGAGVASDYWLFSRAINLTQGTTYAVSYYAARFAIAGAGNVNNLKVTVGNDTTVAAQTTTVQTLDNYSEDDYVLQTSNFTVPTTGVYYIGFNYTAPAQVQTNYGLIALDDITVDVSAGLNDALIAKLAVSPNPTNGVVNISNSENILINGVTVTDLNGRTVKSSKFDGTSNAQVNISDLASGMYMMTISSDNGTAVKKIIKN